MIEIVERVIVLSWIQTFFQKFIKDNQDEYAEYDIHTKQMERSLPQKIIEGRYQLDTKISYQYPKGKRHMYVQPEDPTVKSDKTNRQKRVEPRSEVHSPEKRRSSDIRSTDTKSREVINKSQKRVELRSEVHSPEIRRSSDSRSTDTKSREVINKSTPPIKKNRSS